MRRFLLLAALTALFVGPAATAAAAGPRPVTLAPVYAAAQGWINGKITPADTAGKVVVVDVFTFDCFNCRNVVSTLRALNARKADGLVVVGVHAPETPYEAGRANVVLNLQKQQITWPVAIDNGFAIWNAYHVNAWPTQLFFDRSGTLRATIVGDSQDAAVEHIVQQLLAEK